MNDNFVVYIEKDVFDNGINCSIKLRDWTWLVWMGEEDVTVNCHINHLPKIVDDLSQSPNSFAPPMGFDSPYGVSSSNWVQPLAYAFIEFQLKLPYG